MPRGAARRAAELPVFLSATDPREVPMSDTLAYPPEQIKTERVIVWITPERQTIVE